MKTEITKVRLDQEFKITNRALKAVELTGRDRAGAERLLDFAQRYYSDAEFFRKTGDWASAFGALNYAHAWLDAGAVLGLFNVDADKDVFVVD